MSIVFIVLTAVVGLAIGVWLGMPGRYDQSADDIERIMESGGRRRRRAKRVFTPLAWIQRNVSSGGPSRERRKGRGRRRGFSLESPEEREGREPSIR